MRTFLGPVNGGRSERQIADALEGVKGLSFGLECRVNDVREQSLRRLVRAGLRDVFLGIESGSQLCLDRMHKRTTVQQNSEALSLLIKARPFWFKPEMSVLFMFSAIVGGISLTLFASMLASRLTKKAKINDALIERVAHFVGYLLIGYFYFRAWDALAQSYTYDPGRSEGLRFLTKGPMAFNFWIGEMLLGMIVPMILLLYKPTRMNRFWSMLALLLVAGGVVAFRWDTNISGLLVVMPYTPGLEIAYTSYRPSLVEFFGRGEPTSSGSPCNSTRPCATNCPSIPCWR